MTAHKNQLYEALPGTFEGGTKGSSKPSIVQVDVQKANTRLMSSAAAKSTQEKDCLKR